MDATNPFESPEYCSPKVPWRGLVYVALSLSLLETASLAALICWGDLGGSVQDVLFLGMRVEPELLISYSTACVVWLMRGLIHQNHRIKRGL